MRDAELARYRAFETERVNREARESRVVEQLEAAHWELGENKEVELEAEAES